MRNTTALIWIPARVGCYWNAGYFHISTRFTIENGKPANWPQSGYLLSRNREEIGMFKTLKAAQRAAAALDRASVAVYAKGEFSEAGGCPKN